MPLNCNTVQAGGAALFMGGPASCQINQRMSSLNFLSDKAGMLFLNRYITVANPFSVS